MKNTKAAILEKGSTLFLKAAVIAAGLAALAICLFALPAVWTHTPDEYPDIAYALYAIIFAAWMAAIPFFVALYQVLLLVSYVDKNKAFSELSASALKRIAYCGATVSAIFAAVLPFFYIWAQKEDAPGLIVICLILSVVSFAVAVLAGVFRRLLREAIAMKSENDLTV
ncbi:MAG TPA: DUF2975 domain-containing protein [Candidatus Saccharimonadales bacterium]